MWQEQLRRAPGGPQSEVTSHMESSENVTAQGLEAQYILSVAALNSFW